MIPDITRWFTGKALATITSYVLPTLAFAESRGYWLPNESRKVRAALNKQAPAEKFARANKRGDRLAGVNYYGMLDDVCDTRDAWYRSKMSGHSLLHAMMYGLVEQAPWLLSLASELRQYCANDEERAALDVAERWAADFAPRRRTSLPPRFASPETHDCHGAFRSLVRGARDTA